MRLLESARTSGSQRRTGIWPQQAAATIAGVIQRPVRAGSAHARTASYGKIHSPIASTQREVSTSRSAVSICPRK